MKLKINAEIDVPITFKELIDLLKALKDLKTKVEIERPKF